MAEDRGGVWDAGEIRDICSTNAGSDRGFQSTVTFASGATTTAESIYFQTDRATTQDNTPEFTLAEGVNLLPQLAGSGQIHSLAWKASTNAALLTGSVSLEN